MKLKELVANSLPRVRGKKKKSPALVTCPVPSPAAHAQSVSTSMSPSGFPEPGHHLPLASPAAAVMAATSYSKCDDDLRTSQLSFGAGLEHAGSRSSFSTFFPNESQPPRRVMKEEVLSPGLIWHGNALYRGLNTHGSWETATEKIFSTEMVPSKFPRGRSGLPYRGMTTSHSAEGISAHHLLMMSRSGYDARMAVSEYGGSCSSQMSVISESAIEAYSSALRQRQSPPQQQQHQLTNLNAHYHQHSHQHFHHYHHHHHHLIPTRGTPLAQQPPPGQRLHVTMATGNGVPTYAVPHAASQLSSNKTAQQHQSPAKDRNAKKQELGFFRKSFASLKGMRKHNSSHNNNNNNTLVSPTPVKAACVAPLTKANLAASEHLRCSVCPYPDKGGVTSAAAGSCDKPNIRPVKPKRRGFKGLSKSKSKKIAAGKENKADSGDASSCFSDNDAQSMIVAVGQPIADCPLPGFYPTWDRSRPRDCSVDSFASSRVCGGSRDGSCYRDTDLSGFDTASLSGYESDFHRGVKAHRSRSRIRTNPWLPSPQPSLGMNGGCRRGEGGAGWDDNASQLRESQEDMAIGEDLDKMLVDKPTSSRAIARSASFEHRRPATLKSLTSSYHPGCQNFSSVNAGAEESDSRDNLAPWTGDSKQQDKSHSCEKPKQRPLTPSVDPDSLLTMSLDRPQKSASPAVVKKHSWWNFGRRGSKKEAGVKLASGSIPTPVSSSTMEQNCARESVVSAVCSSSATAASTASSSFISVSSSNGHGSDTGLGSASQNTRQTLNDLNMATTLVKSRPCSIVSPNSEFVLLAGHLEQLANNISFEYEDTSNSAAGNSTSDCNRNSTLMDKNCKPNIVMNHDGNVASSEAMVRNGLASSSQKNRSDPGCCSKGDNLILQTPESPFSSNSCCSLSSPGLINSNSTLNTAHSPDSGVGGLGSTDGDDSLSSCNVVKTPGSPHCARAASSDPDFESMLDEQYLCIFCPKPGNSVYYCNNSQLKQSASKLGEKSVAKTNSMSSGPDEDSSATISESDVDNTHYHDENMTSAFFMSNSDLVANSSPSKNNYHNLKVNLQQGPVHRQRIVMGSRATTLDHMPQVDTEPNGNSDVSRRNTVCSRKIACRPSELKTTQSSQGLKTDKISCFASFSSDPALSRREVPTNNIPISECGESPSEDLQTVPNRMTRTCHLDAAMILEANLRRVKAPSVEDSTFIDDAQINVYRENKHDIFQDGSGCCFGISQGHAVPLNDDEDEDKRSHATVEMASVSADPTCMDCSVSSRGDEERSLNNSFDMSDACVQTDFDDEFPRWDDIGVLDSLEESALDPAESTRRWLLTGNMQGSADTGYASQTRESQIYMDDDTFHLSGCPGAETFRSWLTHTADRLSSYSSEEKTPRNSACFDTDPDFTMGPTSSVTGLCASLEEGPVVYQPDSAAGFDQVIFVPSRKMSTGPHSTQKNQDIPLRSDGASTRSISPSTVDQMFSDIEHQFHEIFQQRRASHRYTSTSPNPKRFSDSSDSTLASEGSGDSSYSGGVPVGELHDVAARWREADVNTRSSQQSVLRDKDETARESNIYANIPVSSSCESKEVIRKSVSSTISAGAKNPSLSTQCHSHGSSEEMPRVDKNSDNCEGSAEKTCSTNEQQSVSPSSKHDTADYLEFLRDAPLDRTNLKRPLFLVPGVGSVDMSCPETVKFFSNEPCQALEKEFKSFSHNNQNGCAQASSMAQGAKKMKSNGKTQKAEGSRKQEAHAHPEGNGSDRTTTPSAQQNSPFRKSHPPTAAGLYCSHLGHKSKNKVGNTNGGLSFENKSYQCLGGLRKDKPGDRKTLKTHSLHPKPEAKANSLEDSQTPHKISEMDNETRLLAERVIALKREKDDVYRKLQAAQLEELTRKGNLKDLRRHAQSNQKDILLRTLRELRDKLEEQKRLLQQRGKTARQEKVDTKNSESRV